MTVPFLDTISIEVFCHVRLLIGPVIPLMVAWAREIFAVPKFARGKTPYLDDGASTIHSAEERCAVAVWVVENFWPVVLSVICNLKAPELNVTLADIESPGEIVMLEILVKGFGNISHHAKYRVAPELVVSCSVPSCSTDGELKPSIPTQTDEKALVAPVTVGTIQEPLTFVTALDAGVVRFVSAA